MDENQPGPNPMSTLNQSIEDLLNMTTRLDENQPGSNQSIEDDLLNFLKNLNLEEHYIRLKDEDVDLETLFLCKNHGDLEQLGITKAGQRMRLLKAMEPGSAARALSTPSISALVTSAPARSASTTLTSAPLTLETPTSAPVISAPVTSAPSASPPLISEPPTFIPAPSNHADHGDTFSPQTETSPLFAPITSAPAPSAPTPSTSTLVNSTNEQITKPITSEPSALEPLVIISPPNYGQPNTPPPAYGEVGENFPGDFFIL